MRERGPFGGTTGAPSVRGAWRVDFLSPARSGMKSLLHPLLEIHAKIWKRGDIAPPTRNGEDVNGGRGRNVTDLTTHLSKETPSL